MSGRAHGSVLVSLALPLPLVDLGVSLTLITSGKLATAFNTGKRFLPSVRADVRSQVVAAAEAAHANATLKWLLARMHPHMAGEFVRAREAAVAAIGRTGVRPLVRRCLALPACR